MFKAIKTNEHSYQEGVDKMDLAALQIGGAAIDPATVDLRATSCQWVHLEEMEKKCQPGEGFMINKVNRNS